MAALQPSQALGREEYLVEERPLSTFACIQRDVIEHGQAFLVVCHRDDVVLEVRLDLGAGYGHSTYSGHRKPQHEHRNLPIFHISIS